MFTPERRHLLTFDLFIPYKPYFEGTERFISTISTPKVAMPYHPRQGDRSMAGQDMTTEMKLESKHDKTKKF